MIIPFKNATPKLGSEVFVAPDAWVIGDVELADNVSVFFACVLRGDVLPIRVGSRTNIQEHSMLHTSHGRTPVIIGEDVTIGHRAVVHGCTVGNRTQIGMGAILLDGVVVGEESIVAAGAVLPENKSYPKRSLIMGIPGKVVREISDEELEGTLRNTTEYVQTGRDYLAMKLKE